jgi:Uma2 family endonuclease
LLLNYLIDVREALMRTDITKNRKGMEFLIPAVYSPSMWEDTIPKKESYTYEDYAKLPEGAPYQLIRGNLVMTPSPTPYHQEISRKLEFKILGFVEERKLGHVYYAPLDVFLSDREVYQPDIIFIRKERKNIIGRTKIEGPPDIVIEILSPSTAYYDLREKFRTYEQSGVGEYWIVDPGLKKIEVYVNDNKKFIIHSETEGMESVSSRILEEFKLSPVDIF